MSVASMSPDTSHSGVEFRSPHSPYYGSVYIDSEATISEMTTRRLFGFPATPAFVNELKNSSHDVGSSTVSLPLTVEETEELERRSAIHTLFSDHLEAIVRSRADFGGVYIDQLAGGKVVVLTTGDPAVVASELSAIEPRMRKNLIIRPVSFSWSQLSEALGRLFDNRTAWFRDVPVYEASIEVEHNAISVSVPQQRLVDVRRITEDVSAALGGIAVHPVVGRVPAATACFSRTTCYSPMPAGIRIGPAAGVWTCTMGFHITISGSKQFLTAGHCAGSTWYHIGYGQIGTQQATLYPSQEVDIKRVTNPSSQHTSLVYVSPTTGHTSVTGMAWPIKNSQIMISRGSADVVSLGTVTKEEVRYLVANCDCIGGQHSRESTPGDSGSPVWRQTSSSRVAIGIQSTDAGHFGRLMHARNFWNFTVP
jgi:hypothetical protein